MIKIIKSNKFIVLLLFIICILYIINPAIYSTSCLNAVSAWGLKVFPLLFPFFIFTRLIINLCDIKPNFMDKFFKKSYHAPTGSFFIFCLSILSGYPMGAKLISTYYENGNISKEDAKKMLSFCSVSGPMFMIGTVGVAILNSYKAGLIILICNLIACLINGFIFRGKPANSKPNYTSQKKKENLLSDCVYDSLISILVVGAYMVLSFSIITALTQTQILTNLANAICCVPLLNNSQNIVVGFLSGLIEITHGIISIGFSNISLATKTFLSSGLIGFGGISIIMQSSSFLNKVNISIKYIIIQKLCQALICFAVSIPICLLFL